MADEPVYYSTERRWFYRGDRKVPSAGRILNLAYPMSPWITQHGLDRGSAVHLATTMIDAGTLDWDDLDGELHPYCDAYAAFLDMNRGIKIVARERKVCHPSGRCSGKLDAVYEIVSMPWIVDIKLGGASERGMLQLCCYSKCYFPADWRRYPRALLLLGKNGRPDFRPDEKPDDHADAWEALEERYWREVENAPAKNP